MFIQIAQFLLGLSILIVLHEFGHFIPAKLFGTRVEKFYLFFDYKFSLIKKKIGDTVYGIGWIPLGGYVKISGMVDESMDTDGLSKEPEPWEFRAKPAWQRLIILTGGVIVNFVLAIVIYAGMMAYYGESYIESKNVKYGYTFSESMKEHGYRDGDKIVSIGGDTLDRADDVRMSLLVGLDEEVVVDRNGEMVSLTTDDALVSAIINDINDTIFPLDIRVPYIAGTIIEGSAAEASGIQIGDSIYALNGEPLLFLDQYLAEVPNYKFDTITLDYYRDGVAMSTPVYVDSTGKIGLGAEMNIPITHTIYSGMSAITAGWDKSISKLDYYLRQFKIIFSPETGAAGQIGGFKTMMQQYEEGSWNWERFWGTTAFISIMLGFLNILPIPALDGGHVVFTLIEMATGRKPSIKVLEYAQMIGFFLLLGLLVYANLNDFGVWDIFKG
ncbi:MAG: RIP metalloprotease RseP [Bacteroidetes bacterium]|nr:MAG: RIP metalloprotease RseP [Bacteroidota bacterium]